MKNTKLIIGVLLIVVGITGFWGGMKYQQSKGFSMTGRLDPEQTRRSSNSGMVSGEIIDRDETSITVKQADESTKIILLSENTGVSKTSEGSVDDLKTGETVMIFGQKNPDGSISAANIQLNPQFREGLNIMHR
ncbi:MAG TPA: hypothetical protein VMX76_01120 [Nevskiaceae bacterium]|nr:hypothetical protein [Nevskiaceae bacterium]